MCRQHQPTLADILPMLPNVETTLDSGVVVYPDCNWRNEKQRAQLWMLRDYLVSSVSGGSIWLLPRETGRARDVA